MQIVRNGLILFTNQQDKLIDFYLKIFDATILFQTENDLEKISCLEVGNIYIMIESFNNDIEFQVSENPNIKIRFNIDNLSLVRDKLLELEVKFDYKVFDWGESIDFYDPDGNLIGIRDSNSFEQQIKKK